MKMEPIGTATLYKRIAELEQQLAEAQKDAERLRAQLQTSYEQEVNSRGRREIAEARDKWMRIAQEAQKDAERYRWLKERTSYTDGEDGLTWAVLDWNFGPSSLTEATLDAAIDAARGED